MDAPLTKGPAPKWERQGMNRSASSTSSLANTNGSFVGMNASRSTTTKTPGKGKTPGSAAKKKPTGLTPGNDVGKRTAFADRFIPSRATTHFDIGQHSHLQAQDPDAASGDSSGGDSTAHKRMLEEELGVGKEREVIFSYSVKPAPAPADHVNSLKVVYTQGSLPPSVQKTAGRFISTKPDRILDAPALMDDFYLHPIDWSRNNHVAVALTDSVYVWNAGTSEIHHLANMCADDNDDNTATSVSWIEAGTHLAIGTSDGEVWLYDVAASRRVRRMRGHTSRVPCLAWNEYIISSGSATGAIYHYDVRVAEFKVSGCPQAHSGLEVCGLSWSPDQRYLASGGNDNAVKIWVPGDNGSRSVPDGSEPVHTFTHHQAAVKALAWCPWKPNVLASGGGTNDRHIRLWNVASGALLKELDTQSQVSALAWSEEYHEIVSAHGHASNQVVIWRFPGMEKVARLEGHEARVLDMSMSPDRTTIVTAGADETLRIWKCFAVDEERKKAKLRREAQAKGGRSAFQTLMR